MTAIRPKIAIVDDDDSVCRALERLLRAAGMEVETFCAGNEFLAALDSVHIDCVILDLHMPTVSGFDVQRQLARYVSGVAVVVITGRDTPESGARARAEGAAAYLTKPVDEKVLLDAIAAAIRNTPA